MRGSSEIWDSEEMNNHVTFLRFIACMSQSHLSSCRRKALGNSHKVRSFFLSVSCLLPESHQHEGQQHLLESAYAGSVQGGPGEIETLGC